jgi:hypothetical protein
MKRVVGATGGEIVGTFDGLVDPRYANDVALQGRTWGFGRFAVREVAE